MKASSEAATSLSVPRHPLPKSIRAASLFCFFLIVGSLALLRGPTLFSTTNLVMAVFLVLSIFTCVTSLYSVPTQRYAVLPGVGFLLLLLLNTDVTKSRIHRYACSSLLACGLAAGMIAYRTTYGQEGPAWAAEVQRWHADHHYPLRVWPWYVGATLHIESAK